MGVRDLVSIAAVSFGLSGCSVEDSVADYLTSVFPPGTEIEVVETCGGSLGLNPAVALFEVTFPTRDPMPDLTALAFERGIWTRETSLQGFAAKYDAGVGIAATVLDGKDCLRHLRENADHLLGGSVSGLYYRSNNQMVVMMMPDDEPGTGVLFTQGR